MSKNYVPMSKMLVGSLLIGSTVCLLCSCSQKLSESSHTGDGYSQRTEVVREGDRVRTTTVTSEVDPLRTDDSVKIDTNNDRINVRLPEDHDNDGRVDVKAPFVRLHSDDYDGSVHVRAPFLKVDKDGHGDKVRVRIPGIRINAD